VAYYDYICTHFQHQDCPGSPATGLRRWGGSLGTERMRTSSNGSVEGTYTSFPWGDSEVPTGTDTDANHFATLDHDTESNTDHAEFRQYSNTQGRFLSPDPYDGSYDPTNPQSFNRYVYAMNNPLSNIDPSGRDCIYDNGNGSFTTEYGDCASTSDGGYYVDCDGCLNGATVTGIIQNQNPNIVDLAAYTTSAGLYDVNGNLLDPTASVSVNANPPQLAVAGMSVGGSAPGGSGGGGGALNNAPGRAIPPSPHNNNNQTFTQCMGGELINNFLGSSDNAGVTVAVHVAAIAARQAAGGLLPGPGWVYTGAAALWDVAQVGKSYVS
jgi:RHS repeat-associated protein